METQQALTYLIIAGGTALTILIFASAIRITVRDADGDPIPLSQATSAIFGSVPLVFIGFGALWGLTFLPAGTLHLSNDQLWRWGPYAIMGMMPIVVAGILAQRYGLQFSNAIVRVYGAFLFVAACAFALVSFVEIARAAM